MRRVLIVLLLTATACGGRTIGNVGNDALLGPLPDARPVDGGPLPDAGPADGGPENLPPVAHAADLTVVVGTTVTVSGSGSYDPEGLPLTYSWSVLQTPLGSSAALDDPTAVEVTFVADQVGQYRLELTVHDGVLPSSPAQAVVTASATGLFWDVANGIFDPGEVYLAGTVSPGLCGTAAAVHWTDPTVGSAGFDCYFREDSAQIRADGRMLYVNTFEDLLREFHCDGCPGWAPGATYPSNVLANDLILATPCSPVQDFRLGITGRLLYKCQYTWQDDTGTPLGNVLPLSYGYDDRVLVHDSWGDPAVLDLATGVQTPVTGVTTDDVITTRVYSQTEFRLAVRAAGQAELWRVDHQGLATLEGVYPPEPSAYSGFFKGALDSQGELFQIGRGPATFEDVILRRTLGGISEVVYTEATNPPVQIHISDLFTGP